MKKVGALIDHLKNGGTLPNRHSNPYIEEALGLGDCLVTEQELKKNDRPLFARAAVPLIVEIGCYMGKNVVELAENNPDKNILGLDITYKRVVKAARRLKQKRLENSKIAASSAQFFFSEVAPPESVSGVCLFFPDPWPKDRDEKNRLLNDDFLCVLKNKLKPSGFVWFKSDHERYFFQTRQKFLDAGFIICPEAQLSENGVPLPLAGGPYETSFEKLFMDKGIKCYCEVFLKTGQTAKTC